MEIIKYTWEYENLAEYFTCGNIVIDSFLRDGNALDENQGITYVLLSDKKDVIIGFYNIEVGRVDQVENISGGKSWDCFCYNKGILDEEKIFYL